jgi:hypothetical protein
MMVPRKTLFAGILYTHDSWDHYWEGSLYRVNGNIGKVTTQTTMWTGTFGILDRLNVIANVPYVWTNASQGVLSGMSGWQDVTLAAKYRIVKKALGDTGYVSAFGVVSGGFPMTDYQPDFQPLSIGLGASRISGRFTANYLHNRGWCLTGTAAYTWQSDVTIDAPYYFTNNQLFLTNNVKMPDVVDYSISPGYVKNGLMAEVTFSKMITQGGANVGDIRRQDMPFISNRFISSRIGGMVMHPLPIRKLKSLSLRAEYSYVIAGRNVGQSSTVALGLFETLSLRRHP